MEERNLRKVLIGTVVSKEVRKDIARINTVLTERKLAESKNA